MGTILIRGGRLADPDTGFDGIADLLTEDGRIRRVGDLSGVTADRVIDAEGLTVLPGLVDLHVHLRDPGQIHKEDVLSGCAAAARGGVTALLAMPNTNPPVDSIEGVRYVEEKARPTGVRVFQSSAITSGMRGEALVPIKELVAAGVKGFTEDGKSVLRADLLREAMLTAKELGVPVMEHCEDPALVRGGVMNEDAAAKRLGFPGIPNAAEDVIVARDCMLAFDTGAHLHLQHCSTAGAVEAVRAAKRAGAHVTAEACPHHFTLTSDDIPGDDANYKMNPPLRTQSDVDAVLAGLADGTIDCISTDHAPHTAEEKARGFLRSPFGIVGLETSAVLSYTALVKTGRLTLLALAERMSRNPARILGIEGGSLKEGARADIALFDFTHPHVIDPLHFASRGRNTPFAGRTVYGRTVCTIAGGEIIWEENA